MPPAASARVGRASDGNIEHRVTRLEGRHDSHVEIDDLRFGEIKSTIAEVKSGMAELRTDMKAGLSEVKTGLAEVAGALAKFDQREREETSVGSPIAVAAHSAKVAADAAQAATLAAQAAAGAAEKVATAAASAARRAGDGGRGTWRVGPWGQKLLYGAITAIVVLIGWLGEQLWLEEPARVQAAMHTRPPVSAPLVP